MADGGGLENRYGVKPIVGSNPTPSALSSCFVSVRPGVGLPEGAQRPRLARCVPVRFALVPAARRPSRAATSASRRRWRAHGLNTREQNLRQNLKRLYGLTPEDVEAMAEAQGHRCEVCGRHEDEVRRYVGGRRRLDGEPAQPRGLVVDHCHKEGHVRALLCSGCNQGLGQCDDDAERLRAAADWLDKVKAIARR